MNFLVEAFAWIADPTHWPGPNGIWTRLGEHLAYGGFEEADIVIGAEPAAPAEAGA